MYKLIIVDDEQSIRNGMANGIPWNDWGFEVIGQASDGLEALELVENERPDVVLSDIRMPRMDGVELMQRLHKDYPDVKVIILSGYSDFEAARKMLSSGMVVEYLLKPASEDELFEAVFKCIERIDQTRGPDDPVPLEEPGPEPPSFHENAQPRGSKVLLIQQVKEYLQENYTQRITLNSAAALVYLTPTYLSKLFAEVEGMGFSEYLSALRIQHAKEALLDYHRRIYEIAAQVGYQDVKHFMKVFKKQVGMTPREYRESHLF